MASVFKPPGKSKYYIEYHDENNALHRIAAYTDKQLSEDLKRHIERHVERLRAGEIPQPFADPRMNKRFGILSKKANGSTTLEHARPLYLAELLRKGTPERSNHHKESERILRTLADKCHWTTLADITTESFTAFLRDLHQQGRAARTQNRYHEVLRAFLNWSVTQGWLEANPIASMKMLRQNGKARRHNRRAYTLEEWQRLIAAAPEPRKTVYLVASFSGLRRSELHRLIKADCTPTASAPTWHARPEVTKNGQAINLPMLPDCARALVPIWTARPQPSSTLLVDKYGRSSVPHIVTLHQDLKAAAIPRQDAQGRCADFHSFRYFFCTQLARILPMREVQVLMRHSTITLTMNLYNDLGIKDVADHVRTLPSLFPLVTDQFTDPARNAQEAQTTQT